MRWLFLLLPLLSCKGPSFSYQLQPAPKIQFRSMVDCNMATAWVGDTFRIFPGKYGEDPLWGESHELKWADGKTVFAAFDQPQEAFTEPRMPANVPPGTPGLHGAVWFEAMYQPPADPSGKTLYALYHNENYPATLPYNARTGEGYKDSLWPEGLRGPETPAAVCRIGIMKSTDGGRSWSDRGIVLEDLQPRLILKPHNRGIAFAGGVGDPSAVASGDHLYIFYGEYGYPETYHGATYDPEKERAAQCISVARIALSDLDQPAGKAYRWDGTAFRAPGNGPGKPVTALQTGPVEGAAASSPVPNYYWGPSVSWNEDLNAWVMLMARAEGPYWKGSKVYISFNPNRDLGKGNAAQQWTKPEVLFEKPGHTLWYPALQPADSEEDLRRKRTSVRLGSHARFFYKDNDTASSHYVSEHIIRLRRK